MGKTHGVISATAPQNAAVSKNPSKPSLDFRAPISSSETSCSRTALRLASCSSTLAAGGATDGPLASGTATGIVGAAFFDELPFAAGSRDGGSGVLVTFSNSSLYLGSMSTGGASVTVTSVDTGTHCGGKQF